MRHFADLRKNTNEKTDYRYYRFRPAELLGYLAVGSFLGLLICWLCYHSVYALPVAAAAAAFYLFEKKKALAEKRRQLLSYHFKDFLSALQTALSAGYSVENGVQHALADMRQLYGEEDCLVAELKRIAAGLKLHRPVEELFADLGERSDLEDIRLFAELLSIARRQGGRMGKVISDVQKIICEKIETAQEIDKILASKIYEQKIMSLMPAAVILYLRLTFDGFIEQLYGNAAGVCIMTICLGVYAAAWLLGKRIVRIEV